MRLKAIADIVKTAGKGFFENDAMMRAAALGFYSMMALAPLLVIFVSVTGFLGENAQTGLIQQVETLIGLEASQFVGSLISYTSENRTAGVTSTLIGALTSLFWTTAVFAHLQTSMNRVWGVRAKLGYGAWFLLRKRILSLAMVAGIGLLLLASVALTTAWSVIFPGRFNIWVVDNVAVPLLLFTPLFAAIFKLLPDVRIAWRDVRIGGFLTAVLFGIGKLVIGKYLAHRGIGSAYGAAGSLVVFLLWVYYVSLLVLFGAHFTRAYVLHFGSQVVPVGHARWVGTPMSRKGIAERPTRGTPQ
jgi:membrane protein